MVTTLGFHELTGVGVLVNFGLTRLAVALLSNNSWRASRGGLWVKNGYDIAQAVAVFREQITKLFFELDFAL
ncbi:hypothetical protein D3C77_452710 [compost metagenome]